jgi:hypothetical protein
MKPRAIFVSTYTEPLKAILPVIKAASERFDVFVLNLCTLGDHDRSRSETMLKKSGIPFLSVTGDNLPGLKPKGLIRLLHYPLETIGKTGPVDDIVNQMRIQELARNLTEQMKPDILVTTVERRPMERYIMAEAHKRGVPSLLFQWGLGSVSQRSAAELSERFSHNSSYMKSLKAKLAALLQRTLLSHYRLLPPPRTVCPWGEDATRFAVVGPSSVDTFSGLGFPMERMVIVGHPLYEQALHEAEGLRGDPDADLRFRKDMGILAGVPVVLWCTNDQRTYYENQWTYDEMYSSWEAKVRALVETAPDIHVVVKLHPKERIADYRPLGALSERVIVIQDYDVMRMIPHCQVLITRFSTTAVYAMCYGVPVITYNYPPISGGVLYEDTGGTIHVNSDSELVRNVAWLLEQKNMPDSVADSQRDFLKKHVSVTDRPTPQRLVELMCEMLSKKKDWLLNSGMGGF